MTDQNEQLDIINRGAVAARAFLAGLEENKRLQPERLGQARAQADDEKIKALAAEPWADVVAGIPTVDFSGILTMPTIDGKELFGTRLAFDLLGCCADEDQVAEKLTECYSMIGDPAHMFLVCAAALDTIANHVVPVLLDNYEEKTSDYEVRVRLADAARNAWAARVVDLTDGAGEAMPS